MASAVILSTRAQMKGSSPIEIEIETAIGLLRCSALG